MDFLTNVTLRKGNRLVRLALWTCCLALLMGGNMDGQDRSSTSRPLHQPRHQRISSSWQLSTTGSSEHSTLRTQLDPLGHATQRQVKPTSLHPTSPQDRYAREVLRRLVGSTWRSCRVSADRGARARGRILPIFGADLFNTTPSTFAPVDNIPVTPDYVIGPGDELRLQIWGQVNQHGSFVVDRTGSISLPEVGTIHVAGLQFSQLSDFLKSQLGRVYRNFDLNVNLGQLRSIQVFVVGQARKPGSYTIGSLSTLLNALFASGGPLPQGSLRDIQVKRGAGDNHPLRSVRPAAARGQEQRRPAGVGRCDLHPRRRPPGGSAGKRDHPGHL